METKIIIRMILLFLIGVTLGFLISTEIVNKRLRDRVDNKLKDIAVENSKINREIAKQSITIGGTIYSMSLYEALQKDKLDDQEYIEELFNKKRDSIINVVFK